MLQRSFRLALIAAMFMFSGLTAEAAMQHRIEAGALAPLNGPTKAGGKLRLMHIPLIDGEPATLEVERFEVWAEGADIKVFGPNGEVEKQLPRPSAQYYRGRVAGDPASIVFLAVNGKAIDGLVYTQDRKFAIGVQRRGRGTDAIDVLIQESSPADDIPIDGQGFSCAVEGEALKRPIGARPYAVSNISGEPVANTAPTGTQRSVINLAVDTDYELYQKVSNSAANVTTFVGNLVAATSVIYERDLKTEVRISYLGIQNSSSDPFDVVPGQGGTWDGVPVTYSSLHALLELGDRWHLAPPTTNVRSAVTLVSGKPQLSGIAWVQTLCDSDFAYGSHFGGKYSFLGGITPPASLAVPDPDANPGYTAPSSNYWPLLEMAHELGHNVGSSHTHCISLTPAQKTEYGVTRSYVDECYNGEAGCFTGTQIVPAEKGSIMSYCHLRSGGATNTRFTFGQDGETSEVALNGLIADMAAETPAMSAITAPSSLASGATGNASVTNAGLSYAWTIVNGTFTGGGTTAVGAAVSFSGTTDPVTLTVTATNASGCAVTDTKSVSISTVLSFDPPAGITATAQSATSVLVTWSAVPDATTYKIYRATTAGSFSEIGQVSGVTNYTDNTATANTAYQYTVAAGASSTFSTFGTADLATTVIFTDPTLTAHVTKVKVVHFTQLLTAVNAVRALGGLGAISFTAPAPTTSVTVRRQHLLDLRSGLDAARGAIGVAGLTYTDTTITAQSTTIKAAHINELRAGVQ